MSVNKVIYNGETLIDLTSDTVTENSLLGGTTAHLKSGAKVTGALFSDHPEEFDFLETLTDSSGNALLDNSGDVIQGQTTYMSKEVYESIPMEIVIAGFEE